MDCNRSAILISKLSLSTQIVFYLKLGANNRQIYMIYYHIYTTHKACNTGKINVLIHLQKGMEKPSLPGGKCRQKRWRLDKKTMLASGVTRWSMSMSWDRHESHEIGKFLLQYAGLCVVVLVVVSVILLLHLGLSVDDESNDKSVQYQRR